MSGNSTERLLRALYENVGDGALSISYLDERKIPITRWFTKDQIPEMVAYGIECGKTLNTYLNINPRIAAMDTYHRGKSKDVYEVVTIHVDFDIKGPAHVEKRLPESEKEILDYLAELPHPPSFIIRSGNGIHAYWILKQPYRIRDGTDRAYIESILYGFEAYAIKLAYDNHGWVFDHVADLARMLRLPGTTNFKTEDRPQCEIVSESPVRYDLADFEQFATAAKEATETEEKEDTEPEDDFALMGKGSGKELIDTEMVFPNADVRFIAINNGVDSANQAENDMTPFINIFNEFYAKDTSRKIGAVFKAKGQAGKPLCTNPPYGYVKDPEDKLHWIVDEEAAGNVREVFRLCVQGYGVSQTANEMSKRHVLNPTAYAKANGRQIADNRSDTQSYEWTGSTVSHMLSRPEYLGHTVNFKTYRKSYKQKKRMKNDPSEWQIFENTHEAIIDQETYDIVQRIRDGRRRLTPMGEMPILSGMVFCADCGAKLYQVRYRGWTHEQEHMVCATYRKKGKEICSSHQIRNCVLEELLLDGIRSVTAFARDHEDEFVEMVTKKKRAEVDRSLRDGKRELEQTQTRIRKLDDIIQHLYEDNLEGKISDERFVKLSENYENEQKTLEARVSELRRMIASEQESNVNVGRFLDLVRKYTDIRELTAEVIREFVERIYVHQAERINGKKVQRIRIVWNCIGELTPPMPTHKKETA